MSYFLELIGNTPDLHSTIDEVNNSLTLLAPPPIVNAILIEDHSKKRKRTDTEPLNKNLPLHTTQLFIPDPQHIAGSAPLLLGSENNLLVGAAASLLIERKFVCTHEGCSYSATKGSYLKAHMSMHTGDKPYKCDFKDCTYSAAQPGPLKQHSVIHTDEKAHKCEIEGCDYLAARGWDLKRHMRRRHQIPTVYRCNIEGCEFTCDGHEDLKTHKFVHRGEKRFKCTVEGCGYSGKKLKYLFCVVLFSILYTLILFGL